MTIFEYNSNKEYHAMMKAIDELGLDYSVEAIADGFGDIVVDLELNSELNKINNACDKVRKELVI